MVGEFCLMTEFAESLRDLMFEKKINSEQLANTLEINRDTVFAYFSDAYYPQIDIAIKLSNYFDCSIDYLFGLTDVKAKEYELDMNKVMQNFNDNISSMLKSSGVSNAKAMRDMGMGEFTLYRWRRGMFPKTVTLIAVAKYFGVSIEYLLGHECK